MVREFVNRTPLEKPRTSIKLNPSWFIFYSDIQMEPWFCYEYHCKMNLLEISFILLRGTLSMNILTASAERIFVILVLPELIRYDKI